MKKMKNKTAKLMTKFVNGVVKYHELVLKSKGLL